MKIAISTKGKAQTLIFEIDEERLCLRAENAIERALTGQDDAGLGIDITECGNSDQYHRIRDRLITAANAVREGHQRASRLQKSVDDLAPVPLTNSPTLVR